MQPLEKSPEMPESMESSIKEKIAYAKKYCKKYSEMALYIKNRLQEEYKGSWFVCVFKEGGDSGLDEHVANYINVKYEG
ncbi:MAG: dynein light chain family protein, partial [archaeon]|nr:dynein light chain family protein [archaeon]